MASSESFHEMLSWEICGPVINEIIIATVNVLICNISTALV